MTSNEAEAQACSLAALSVCEALLVALVDQKIIPGTEAMGVLTDATAAHREQGEGSGGEASKAAAAIIRAMLARNASLWENPRT